MELDALLRLTFVGLMVLYVCCQIALTVSQIRATENAADHLPASFRRFVPLAVHRKAADFTVENVQAELVSAIVAALVALLLTIGGGLTLLQAGCCLLWGAGLTGQFILALTTLVGLALIDLPLAWWRQFRISERYGVTKDSSPQWLLGRLGDSLLGLICLAPLLYALLWLMSLTGPAWWLVAWAGTLLCLFWLVYWRRSFLSGSGAAPLPEGDILSRLRRLLRERGLPEARVYTIPARPLGDLRGHSFISRRGTELRLVLSEVVIERLEPEEIEVEVARAIGQWRYSHDTILLSLAGALSFLFWYLFSALAASPRFYLALNIVPDLALPHGQPSPGLALILALILVPTALYPLVLPIHLVTRLLCYAADAYAVRHVGLGNFVSALTKLHDDWRNTLAPGRWYGLANHRRPHMTARVLAAIAANKRQRYRLTHRGSAVECHQERLFNQVLARREQAERRRRQARFWHTLEVRRERAALDRRRWCAHPLPGAAAGREKSA